MISTLSPALLTSRDFLNLSHRRFVRPGFPNSRSNVSPVYYDIRRKDKQPIPFPEKCHGFLYYHQDQHAAPLEGSLRFRVTANNAPSSFDLGRDLLSPLGSPWQIILPQLIIGNQYTRIHDQLLNEKLVTPDQLSRCRELFGEEPRISPHLTLFRLSQEFPVNFTTPSIKLDIVGPSGLHKLEYILFSRKNHVPWNGSAIVRFEPSTSPEYAGRRVLHLRILRIVSPVSTIVKEDSKPLLVKPEEGQLLTLFRDNVPSVWAYDVDSATNKTANALRALWDASIGTSALT
ncbi:hypothetical protein C8R45DRAFT_827249 [Mycena sanguinolenta]|nr:hypothetical protein C8R45DRAFT_827249 [Mycena sanguinolenta]